MTSRVLLAGSCCPAASILALALLSGCTAGTPIAPSSPPGSALNITGNWELIAEPGGGNASIAVYLTSNAGKVSGMAFGPPATDNVCVANGCCGSPIGFFDEPLTGTVDAAGNLKLGTAVAGDPLFAMTGTVNGQAIANGNFTLSGGSCVTQGPITGTQYLPLDGTYSGTLTSQMTGQTFAVSATLMQSSGPNSGGELTLTGMANISGYTCVASGGTAALSLNATYVGDFFNASLAPSAGATLFMMGVLSPTGKTLAVNYGFTRAGSSCNGDGGTGTLTLQ